MRSASRQLGSFAVAGVLGFVVDVGVLYCAMALGAGWIAGRLLSFVAAAYSTWRFNRRFTFAATASPWREWWRYLASMTGGMLVNFLVYSLALSLLPAAWWAPGLAVACGSVAGMAVNFVSAKLFVFKS
ncbi:GtrA family protein [Massilia sp. TN1-12]|uniref:GtrA family protein n=1 Tax=Massilia paldalensis TaxID=3377675 RepID=UPI00384CC482